MQKHIGDFDIAIIGAGIAGASLAAEIAGLSRVVVLERESQPGYHTTGRSAAIYSPIYGPQPIRALTRASLGFLMSPPGGFAEHSLLKPRNATFIAREDQLSKLEAMQDELSDSSTITRIDALEVERRVGLLREGYAKSALWDNGTSEIDVASLHQGYLRQFKTRGGTMMMSSGVKRVTRDGDIWTIETSKGCLAADKIVNAAGAWAEEVGKMAGAEIIGLVPKRRTALMIDPPDGVVVDQLPLIVDVNEEFYLKPDAGKLLISPANEDPEPPCDVQPDEMDIAICVDRIERAFDISVRRVQNSWAGLRSFVADKVPVVGYSDIVEDFYWLAGQGGYGVQSAPAIAQYAAADIMGQPVPEHILSERLNPDNLSPGRLGIGAWSCSHLY